MKRSTHAVWAPLVVGVVGGLMASAAQAQDVEQQQQAQQSDAVQPIEGSTDAAVPEITVTAERRTANVQRVAAAVSVRGGEDLRRQGKFSLNQILENVPGVGGLTSTGLANLGTDSPETGIAVRGVKANGSGQSLPQSATTAVYVDGIYGGVGGSYDLDRVEVLRGPQGTLYGRSATGGVIAIYSRNPDLEKVEGNGLVEIGNYGLRHYQAAASVPLMNEKLGIRVSGDDYRLKGYIAAKGAGSTSVQNLRAKLLAKPTENLSVLLGFALTNTTSGSGGVTINMKVQPFQYAYDFSTVLGSTNQKLRQYWAQVDYDLGGARLTYIPALRTYRQAGTAPMAGQGGFILIQTITAPYDKFYTHELRLASDSDSRLTWQLGGISYNNTARGYVNNIVAQSSGALQTRRVQDRKVLQLGAFGEATFALSDNTRLTGGVRYDKTDVTTELIYTQNTSRTLRVGTPTSGLPETLQVTPLTGDAGKKTFKNFNYKARVEHDLAPGHLLYGGISTGFIPGDVQVTTTTVGNTTTSRADFYEAETLTAFELGSKNRFLGGKLQVNLAGFYYRYGGFQRNITTDVLRNITTFVSQRADMYGGELELIARPTPHDELTLNVSHTTAIWVNTDATFRNVVNLKRIDGIIPTTANAAYTHTFAFANGSELRLRGELLYQSGYDQSNLTAAQRNDGGVRRSYTYLPHQFLGNVSLDWTSPDKRFGLTAYVRNVTNNVYQLTTLIQTITQSPPLTGPATAINGTATLSAPRTFGVVGRVSF